MKKLFGNRIFVAFLVFGALFSASRSLLPIFGTGAGHGSGSARQSTTDLMKAQLTPLVVDRYLIDPLAAPKDSGPSDSAALSLGNRLAGAAIGAQDTLSTPEDPGPDPDKDYLAWNGGFHRDPFHSDRENGGVAEEDGGAEPVAESVPRPAAAVLGTLQLKAVFSGAHSRTALINDQIVQAGGSIQGLKVLTIEPEAVWVSDGGQSHRLDLSAPQEANLPRDVDTVQDPPGPTGDILLPTDDELSRDAALEEPAAPHAVTSPSPLQPASMALSVTETDFVPAEATPGSSADGGLPDGSWEPFAGNTEGMGRSVSACHLGWKGQGVQEGAEAVVEGADGDSGTDASSHLAWAETGATPWPLEGWGNPAPP